MGKCLLSVGRVKPPPDRIPHFPCFIKMCPDHFLNVYSTLEALVFLALIFTMLVQSLLLHDLGGIPMATIRLEKRTK